MALPPDQRPARPQPLLVDFESVQAHYDRGFPIISTFIDPETRMYSCALFRTGKESLEEAEVAKADHTLAKLDLHPGQTLLDAGSGYGYLLQRAREKYGVNGIGLNKSEEQVAFCRQMAAGKEGLDFRLQGWEEFHEPVDRIVSIGAFEHFGRANYTAFFGWARAILPEDGRMLLHTIHFNQLPTGEDRRPFLEYARFIQREIFPGGELPWIEQDPQHNEGILPLASRAGFTLDNQETLIMKNGESSYATTLDRWALNLLMHQQEAIEAVTQAAKNGAAKAGVTLTDEDAIAQGTNMYRTYMKYLTESATWFRREVIAVSQFLLQAIPREGDSLSFRSV